jgi:hypothetical protein
MALLLHSEKRHARKALRRFRVIIRGSNFLVPGSGDTSGPERKGFYVVRTVEAGDRTTAGKLALFDFKAELRISQSLERRFLETGTLAVEETRPLEDDEEDVTSSFIFYPMA